VPHRDTVSAETRASILAAAVSTLRVIDVHEFRMQELARDAGVSVPTVYYHFNSLDGILVEAIFALVVEFLAPMQAAQLAMEHAVASGNHAEFLTALDAFFETSWSREAAASIHQLAPHMAYFRSVAPQDYRMREIQAAAISALVSTLESARERGWIDVEGSAMTFVVVHWTCVLGQAVFWHPAFGPLTGVTHRDGAAVLRTRTSIPPNLRELPTQ